MLIIPNNTINSLRPRLSFLCYFPPLGNDYLPQNFHPWQSPNYMLIGIYCGHMCIVQVPKAFNSISRLVSGSF